MSVGSDFFELARVAFSRGEDKTGWLLQAFAEAASNPDSPWYNWSAMSFANLSEGAVSMIWNWYRNRTAGAYAVTIGDVMFYTGAVISAYSLATSGLSAAKNVLSGGTASVGAKVSSGSLLSKVIAGGVSAVSFAVPYILAMRMTWDAYSGVVAEEPYANVSEPQIDYAQRRFEAIKAYWISGDYYNWKKNLDLSLSYGDIDQAMYNNLLNSWDSGHSSSVPTVPSDSEIVVEEEDVVNSYAQRRFEQLKLYWISGEYSKWKAVLDECVKWGDIDAVKAQELMNSWASSHVVPSPAPSPAPSPVPSPVPSDSRSYDQRSYEGDEYDISNVDERNYYNQQQYSDYDQRRYETTNVDERSYSNVYEGDEFDYDITNIDEREFVTNYLNQQRYSTSYQTNVTNEAYTSQAQRDYLDAYYAKKLQELGSEPVLSPLDQLKEEYYTRYYEGLLDDLDSAEEEVDYFDVEDYVEQIINDRLGLWTIPNEIKTEGEIYRIYGEDAFDVY